MSKGIYYRFVYITRNWYGKAMYNSKITGPYKWELGKLTEITDFQDEYKCIVLSMEEIKV